ATRPRAGSGGREDPDLERALAWLDDLDAERRRGALTEAEYGVLATEARQEAALELRARDQEGVALLRLVDAWLTRAHQSAPQPGLVTPAAPEPCRDRHPLWWAVPAGGVALAFIGVLVAITVTGRATAGRQTIIGRVGASSVTAAAASHGDPQVIVATNPAGLARSADGGSTWSPVALGAPPLALAATGEGFVGVTAAGLKRSLDGATWTPASEGPALTQIASSRGGRALVGITATGEVLASSDGGSQWTTFEIPAPAGATGLAVVDGASPLFIVSTRDEGMLAGSGHEPWRSANGFVNGALPTVVVRAVHYEPQSGDRFTSAGGEAFVGAVYVATDAGVFKSVDGMQAWSRLGLVADVVALTSSAAEPRTIIAIARDGAVYRSRDGGVSWA
ncbi:MAG: hypothetical protein FJ029_14885, partial [Actinobacteria bacterium]|nr:hypothetical protein [Actinomycetota bacterium]